MVYAVQPPVRKVLQVGGLAKRRQPYLLGRFHGEKYSHDDFRKFLVSIGFEKSKLAWSEAGEAISMRRVDGLKFQWHVRVFKDGEVRGHYEYSPESHPIRHLRLKVFKPDREFLLSLFQDYVK